MGNTQRQHAHTAQSSPQATILNSHRHKVAVPWQGVTNPVRGFQTLDQTQAVETTTQPATTLLISVENILMHKNKHIYLQMWQRLRV